MSVMLGYLFCVVLALGLVTATASGVYAIAYWMGVGDCRAPFGYPLAAGIYSVLSLAFMLLVMLESRDHRS